MVKPPSPRKDLYFYLYFREREREGGGMCVVHTWRSEDKFAESFPYVVASRG